LGKVKKKKTRAQYNIDFIQKHCRIPEAPKIGQPVQLKAWQKREIEKIYNNEAGTRRAIISWGRKNAKVDAGGVFAALPSGRTRGR
jgi:phage terminase large subunit-like protein